MRALDTLIFGDAPSESAHQLAAPDTETFMGALSQSARRSLPSSPPGIYGGSLTFTMKVDPTRRTYVTVKLWGEDEANGGADLGRMYLYVVNDGKDYQVGYRHEGDYVGLNVAGSKAPLAGRFFYASTLLPFAMTQGRSSLTLKVVSAGRIYPLGSGLAPAGNYQFLMSGKGRGVYRAYTHTQALLDVSEEAQGRAPASSVRSVPGVEVMQPGGAFYEGVASRIKNRVAAAATVDSFSATDVEYLAASYGVAGLPGFQNAAVVDKVTAVLDAYATDFYARGDAAVTSGGNEGWGGRYGFLGWAIHLLSVPLQSRLGVSVDYGSGGMKTRSEAWSEMLLASRDLGRAKRDDFYITNQSLIANTSIYKANRGLLALGNSAAFPEPQAQRYLREACGLEPWLGSDLANGSSSRKFGDQYLQVTPKGLTREWGYVGISYGELQSAVAELFAMTGEPAFKAQAVKMLRARAPFRRPALETDGSEQRRSMQGVGLLAWRGAGESDGDYADEVAYGDRTAWAAGLHTAAITGDPTAIGYAKQMLLDNQYFAALVADSRTYSDLGALRAFADYDTIKVAPDSGARLPMSDGAPDFAWTDEASGILALKHGGERLWLAPYFQAKTGTGINGIARFWFSTEHYDQHGVLESDPQFEYAGAFTRPNRIDKPEADLYLPPDPPLQAYAGEQLPLAASELAALPTAPDSSSYAPFRGKALFYAMRFGRYLIGMNASIRQSFVLKTPSGWSSGQDLVSGATLSSPVTVPPSSTVIFALESEADLAPLPRAPLLVNAATSGAQVTLSWAPSSGASSYSLLRADSKDGPPVALVASLHTPSYSDTSVAPGSTHYYCVIARNELGDSYPSMQIKATIAP